MTCVTLLIAMTMAVAVDAQQPGTTMPPAGSSTAPVEKDFPAFLRPDAVPLATLNVEDVKAAAAYSEKLSGRAMLVMQAGAVVFEQYGNGWSASRPHPLASGTKSFTGVVAMAAIEDGLIANLDEVVSETITEWKADPRKSKITVRQLLELSSGLEPDHESLGRAGAGIRDLGPINELATRLRGGREVMPKDRFAAAAGIPATSEPGVRFRYGPSHYYAFGEFLTRKLKASTRAERTFYEYLNARVLTPAGIAISVDRFAPDQAGNPNLPGGGHLTAKEWAMFGEFIRLGGAVRDRDGALAPSFKPGALEPCFKPSKANSNYGLTWWLLNGKPGEGAEVADAGGGLRRRLLGDRPKRQAGQTETIVDRDGKPIRAVMAAGAGKQRLYIVPDYALVVVRFAEMNRNGDDFNDAVFLRRIFGLDEPHVESTTTQRSK